MTWSQRHRVRHYCRNSIWILPALGILAALAAIRMLHGFDEMMGWESALHPDATRALLGALAASMFTFVVFVSSALLIVVQLASAQLTPRIIAVVFRDPITKLSLTVFVFTFTLTLGALLRVTTTIPLLTTQVAVWSCVGSLVVFLILVDHVGKALRPSGALRVVGRVGRAVIESVYPRALAPVSETSLSEAPLPAAGRGSETVIASSTEGVILAFDLKGLVAQAQRANCVIEMVPEVGDFIATGDPLFRIMPMDAPVWASALRGSVAVGQERTVEQDPAFVFRILVDIASKGLSPAINDPTTAVLVIDQIHHLLHCVGNRCLDEGRVRDTAGRLRVIYRTPGWEDFVQLAITEIRHFGGESIQVARRMRAMLENLIQVLPAARTAALRRELELLQRAAQRSFAEPEDRALAEVSDLQGVGSGFESRDGAQRKQPGATNGPAVGAGERV
jgi:uncharacterized membrane protein